MPEPLDYSRAKSREPSEWDLIPLWLVVVVAAIVAGIIGVFVYGWIEVQAAWGRSRAGIVQGAQSFPRPRTWRIIRRAKKRIDAAKRERTMRVHFFAGLGR